MALHHAKLDWLGGLLGQEALRAGKRAGIHLGGLQTKLDKFVSPAQAASRQEGKAGVAAKLCLQRFHWSSLAGAW